MNVVLVEGYAKIVKVNVIFKEIHVTPGRLPTAVARSGLDSLTSPYVPPVGLMDIPVSCVLCPMF